MQKQTRGRILFFLLFVLLTCAGLTLFIAASVSESLPMVIEVESLDAATAQRTQSMAKRMRNQLLAATDTAILTFKADELNGLAALATHGIPRFKGRVNVSSWEVTAALTLHTPENPLGQFINVRAGVQPSDYGLQLSDVQIGSLSLPGGLSLSIIETIANLLLGDRQGSQLINAVKSVRVEGSEIQVVLHSIADLKQSLRRLSRRFAELRDDFQIQGDPELVRLYYAELCEAEREFRPLPVVPASFYTRRVFQLAQIRSHGLQEVPQENRAALLALGLFLGSRRFEPFIGRIHSAELASCRSEPLRTEFAGRHDLVLHFFYSVMIKLLSDSGVSIAAGEFKELLDLHKTKGGASFTDLAADLAGIRFTELLLSADENALRAQRMLAKSHDEALYFPDVSGLPDELPQRLFEDRFGGVNDPRYKDMLTEIERRIAQRPLYSGQ